MEEIELSKELENMIVKAMKEAFIETFENELNEGDQDSAIMASCKSSKGMMLITGTNDDLLFGALEKLKNTNWSTIPTKNACVSAIIDKLYQIGSSCDITIDNPDVRKSVVNSMESLWKQAVLRVAKYQIAEPAKALQDMKTLFANAFKKMKENA